MVSIIMPCHNNASFVKEAISSVVAQTYEDWELLIVDDASTDGSIDVALSFGDERIHIYRNPTNMGAAHSRNVAIANAKGKYVAFLDADDYWYPNKLERQVEFMESNNVLFSAHHYYAGDEKLNPLQIVKGPKKMGKGKMRRCNWIGCLSAMYNQEELGKIQIDESLKKRNDYAIWLEIVNKAPCHMIPEILAIYRRNVSGISKIPTKDKFKWQKIAYQTCCHKSSFGAWYMALRTGIYSIIKKTFYTKKLPNK